MNSTDHKNAVLPLRVASLLSLACLWLVSSLAAQVTVNGAGGANGIQMTQGTALGASGTQVSIFAMAGSVQRGEINNGGGAGPQLIAIWPCSSAGCIPYANSTTYAEAGLPMGSQGLPLLAGPTPGIPQWGALPTSSFQFLDLQANALATEVANSSTAATTLNELVVFVTVSGGSVATTPTTTPTQGVEGICVASCGLSGTYAVAQIAREGIATCAFDSGGTTAGDYVQASTIMVGKCADVGSTYPINGNQVLGRVLASGSGSVLMVLYPPGTGVSTLPLTTLGDTLYGGASGVGTRLAGNTTSTKNFLVQTGTGTVSAVPAWGTIAVGDVPTLNQNTTGTSGGLTGTPAITVGAVTGTSWNGNTWASGNGTLSIAAGKTLTSSNTMNVAKQAGVAGGIPWYDTTTSQSASALLAANAIMFGGGSAAAPGTGNADFTIDGTAHTLLSGANGLVDLSAITATTGFKVPIHTTNTATAAGVIDYDSTNGAFHGGNLGADALFMMATSGITANLLLKSGSATRGTDVSSSITDSGTFITSTELSQFGNTTQLTVDSGSITATTAATATTVFTLPTFKANAKYSIHCSGTTTQANAGAGIGIAIVFGTTGPTASELHATVATSLTAMNAGATQLSSGNVNNTTAAAIYSSTSGTVTTQLPWSVDGSIEVGATPPASSVIGFFTGNASDGVVVKRDSYCTLMP